MNSVLTLSNTAHHMKIHHKVLHWVKDYVYMIRGAAASLIYIKPPRHYLEYTIDNKVPVILIPGIFGKWSFLKSLGDRISLSGHPVYVIPELGYNIFSIPKSAEMLREVVKSAFNKRNKLIPKMDKGAEEVNKIIKENNLKGVILVAHSKGGLIGKYLLAHYNHNAEVLGLISLATPYSGSEMAKLLPLEPIGELNVDSKIILDLQKHNEVNNKIVSICPKYDNHVWSENGSHLDGAKNIEVDVLGHHKIVFDKKVMDIVMEEIERITRSHHGY